MPCDGIKRPVDRKRVEACGLDLERYGNGVKRVESRSLGG